MTFDIFFNRGTAVISAVLGIVLLPGAWTSIDRGQLQRVVVGTEKVEHQLDDKSAAVPVLDDESRDIIGWWTIKYPATLPLEGSKPMSIGYTPDQSTWGRSGRVPTKMAVKFETKDFNASPEPCLLNIDLSALGRRGLHEGQTQDRTWALSAGEKAKSDRQYTLVLQFDIRPATFKRGFVEIDDTTSSGDTLELPIPVNLPLQIEMREVVIFKEVFWTAGRTILTGISALLALPVVVELAKFVISKYDKSKSTEPVKNSGE